MTIPFLQKPIGMATLIGSAIAAPYLLVGDKRSEPIDPANPSLSQPADSLAPYGYPTNYAGPMTNGPGLAAMPYTLPGVHDLREVLRFDIPPAWVAQSFPQVTTVAADMQLDGYRVPFVSGTKPTDIAGSLTYYFDAHQKLQRLQFLGTTGDPTMLVALMTQYYHLQPETSLGPDLFTTRWNSRVTSLLQLTPAAMLTSHDTNQRFRVFLELNQPSQAYSLTREAEQLLQTARLNQRWQ
jgi:hypothetical protein